MAMPLKPVPAKVGFLTPLYHVYTKGWLCRCVCNEEIIVRGVDLRPVPGNQYTRMSCGCMSDDLKAEGKKTHGQTYTEEYRTWKRMKTRCYIKSCPRYEIYGGRGIEVCERWKDSFPNFLEDMGVKPTKAHQIDRINPDGNYEPGNCRWATDHEQRRNQRRNVQITFQGETKVLSDWATELGLRPKTIQYRLKRLGWSVEKALTTPQEKRPKRGPYNRGQYTFRDISETGKIENT